MLKFKPLMGSIALTLLSGTAIAAALEAGTLIENTMTATYTDGTNNYSATSNAITISIRQVLSSTLTPASGASQTVAATPGAKVYSTHTLTNTGNAPQTFSLTATDETTGDTLNAGAIKIYSDDENTGQPPEGATPITSVSLDPGASVILIVETTLPTSFGADPGNDSLDVTLTAKDSANATVADPNTVHITFTPAPAVTITLEAAPDALCDGTADAAFGVADLANMYTDECAILRSRASNTGTSTAQAVVMSYTVPTDVTYSTGTMTYNGTSVTDANDSDAGKFDGTTVQFTVGDLTTGATSPYAQFSIKIN